MPEPAPGSSAVSHPAATARAALLLAHLPGGVALDTPIGVEVRAQLDGRTIRINAGDIGAIACREEGADGEVLAELDAPSVSVALAWITSQIRV